MDIVPGIDLPFRIITSLSKGPTARADKFIAVNFLRGLQDDYCKDLLKDSTMFLQCLDGLETNLDYIGDRDYLFNKDIEALYDSLDREHVEASLREAMVECRPECKWTEDLVNWLIIGVKLSLNSAVGKFGEAWYNECECERSP